MEVFLTSRFAPPALSQDVRIVLQQTDRQTDTPLKKVWIKHNIQADRHTTLESEGKRIKQTDIYTT